MFFICGEGKGTDNKSGFTLSLPPYNPTLCLPSSPVFPPKTYKIMKHLRRISILFATFLILWTTPVVLAQELVDEEVNTMIREKALDQSQIMETLSWLSDVHGPLLTGSPNLMNASKWALAQLEEWGIENAHLEPWGPFGRGWTLNKFSMHVVSPVQFPVYAYPKAWSGGTGGAITAEAVIFNVQTPAEMEKYRGQIKGKIVLIESPRSVDEPFEALSQRRDAENLLELANAVEEPAGASPMRDPARLRRMTEQQEIMQFLFDEGPEAILTRYSKGDYGTVFTTGASVPASEDAGMMNRPNPYDVDAPYVIPQMTLALEHYNRIYRLVERGFTVTMDINLDVTYHDDDLMAYNIVAEIPGTDPVIGDEVVMLGAHVDSWHTGTGAIDNASGSSVMMEVMRILKEVFDETGKKPRRTIRIALWSGEEQGLRGSRAYVGEHFASLGGFGQAPVELKPEHDLLSAYYNFDNGTGKIRGVYLQGNEAVEPIFRSWLAPFHDLGAATLTIDDTGGTDHLSFDSAGLPGFQFIQDQITYSTRNHHSNMDVLDHVLEDDLKQAVVIVASFVYHTAQREKKLPRKPLQLQLEDSRGG